ncbi:glycosyltransferase, partial [Campylobacter jejuni]|nr:glycosyltransferase [Campylobacter jejuni]
MQDKKVGIVIPIYNVEKYLDECLQSVIDQTYTNLSIVLVNDGSNDNSLSIAKKYALQDERIIIIDKKNGGLSSARN